MQAKQTSGTGAEMPLEILMQMMAQEREEMQLPEELLFGECEQCKKWVHPANNLYLLSDLIEGTTTHYANGLAYHFVPVIAHGVNLCNGAPSFYRFLDGVSAVGQTQQGEDFLAGRAAWQSAFQWAIDHMTDGTECFAFSFKKGIWQQEYVCSLAIKGIGDW